MRRFVLLLSVIAFVLPVGIALGMPGSEVSPAAAAQAGTPVPGAKIGTVLIPSLNVRSGPSTSGRILGKLNQGTQVQVLASQRDWLQIVYPSGPGGRAWVSGAYVSLTGAKPAAAKPAAQTGVPAPRVLAYQDPTFSWQWDGARQMGNQDWYFDVQFYQGAAQDPYHIITAEPKNARLVNGTWYFDQRTNNLQCDSYWVVQIAKRDGGRFAGWVSPKSNRLAIGDRCAEPTDCPGCNVGG